jgi:hypothetical protein
MARRKAGWTWTPRDPSAGYLLFLEWVAAARVYERLRSGPAAAKCRAARAAYYRAVLGYVPRLPKASEEASE